MHEDIISFTCKRENMPFYVGMCGVSYCDGKYEIMRSCANTNVLEYVISGTGIVCENNRCFEASAGDVYFVKEGHKHHYYSDAENPWVKIWFNFTGELAKQITRLYRLEDDVVFHCPELRGQFEEMLEVARSGSREEEICNKIAGIFLKIAQRLSKEIESEEEREDTIATRLKRKIDSQDGFDCGLERVMSGLYCSKNHAIREFKKQYGIAPYEYIQQKRFASAKDMLENMNLPIADIAERLDFYDIHYFSVSFKKRFGITPTEYRKSKRGK